MGAFLMPEGYGQLYEVNESGTTITVATAGTWYPWKTAGVHACSFSKGAPILTHTTGDPSRFTIGANGAGLWQVGYFACVKGENSAIVHSGMLKNGGVVVCSEKHVAARASAAAIQELSAVGIGFFAVGDVIQLAFTSDTNADDVILYHVNHFMIRKGVG